MRMQQKYIEQGSGKKILLWLKKLNAVIRHVPIICQYNNIVSWILPELS